MLQAGEIVIILVLALVLLGPKRMPDMARRIGRWVGEIRNAAQEISQGVQAEVAKATAPFDEVKRNLADTVGEVDPTRFKWTGPASSQGPSPEDALSDLEEINKAAPEIAEEPQDG